MGLNRPWPSRFRWRFAFLEDGVSFDLIFEGDRILSVRSKPLVLRDNTGRIKRLEVRSEEEANQQIKALRRKHPQKTFTINWQKEQRSFRGQNLRLNTGIDVGLLAVKMCVAELALFDDFNRDEAAVALRNLNRPPLTRLSCCLKDARRHEPISNDQPPLSHSIFVERNSVRTYGLVTLFGVLQFYCELGRPPHPGCPRACLGVLDWLGQSENFQEVSPMFLDPPDRFVPHSEIQGIGTALEARLMQEAKRAGATGTATARLETVPAWTSETLSVQGTIDYLLRTLKS